MYSIKREIYLNKEQRELYYKTKDGCRFVYNKMIEVNQNLYKSSKLFMNGINFSKYLNNYLRKGIISYKYEWLNELPSKSLKESILNCDRAFKDFFSNKKGFPNFKSKKRDKTGIYLPKNNKTDFSKIFRNKLKIPIFGFVYLKEFGIIDLSKVKSCTITDKNDRFYISFLINDINEIMFDTDANLRIGIDLGIKDFAVFSNGLKFKGISKFHKLVILEKRRKRLQRQISRKYLAKQKFMKGEKPLSSNYKKSVRAANNIYARSRNIISGYFDYILRTLAITKPKTVVVEDLNIAGMMKNRKLSKKIQESSFRAFLFKLENFCNKRGIEFIKANRFFPSTQTCSNCGSIKQGNNKLSLKDRIYKCNECGHELDRDLNAAINLSNYNI